jgi:hypothetical protein
VGVWSVQERVASLWKNSCAINTQGIRFGLCFGCRVFSGGSGFCARFSAAALM